MQEKTAVELCTPIVYDVVTNHVRGASYHRRQRMIPKRVALMNMFYAEIVIAAEIRESCWLPARDPVMRFAKGPH